MPLAIGGSNSTSLSTHGAIWVDIRDYGAKADGGATDNSGPIQAAVDALITILKASPPSGGLTNSPRGVVYIPNSTLPYVVQKTIWVDYPGIEIRGDGWGSQISMNASLAHNVLQFGARRTETTTVNGQPASLQIDSAHRPDAYNVLDSSAAAAPGRRWGLRTNANSFVQFQASPLCAGVQSSLGQYAWDYWTSINALTMEFCIEPPAGQQFPANTPLFALGITGYQPSPLIVSTGSSPNTLTVGFKTSDIPASYNAGERNFTFSLAGASAPYRVAIQIDLVNAVCSAYVNGVQVALVSTTNLSAASTIPFNPNAGLTFQQNDYFPFMIGADNVHGPLQTASSAIDLSVYGLRLSNTLRYQNNGAGKPQTRTNSPTSPINDAFAYFTNDTFTIAFLTMLDDPAGLGRVVSVQHGQATGSSPVGSGIFLHTANAGGMSGNAVRDVWVSAANGFGQAISLGGVLETTLDNVKATDGFHGVGSLNMYANYNIHVHQCWLNGRDASYYGALQIVRADDLYCELSGKSTVRLFGSSSHWSNVFIAYAAPNAECHFKFHGSDYGGNHKVDTLIADFEGQTLSLAGFYCETHGQTPATSLTLRDIFLGTIGANASIVMLKDLGTLGGEFNRGWLAAENLQAFTNTYLAAVDVDGPLWYGRVDGLPLNGPSFLHRQKWGSQANVVVRDQKYVAPPRQYSWYPGAHLLEARSPVDGQFAEWRCMTAGAYGTNSPPAWAGANVIQLSPNGLAGYITNHGYVTVNIP